MARERIYLADDAAKNFVRTLRRSSIVSTGEILALLRRFCQDYPELPARSAWNFARFLVAAGTLTPWQAKKIAEGRHKGFLMDHYLLLDRLGDEPSHIKLLARDILTNRRVLLAVTGPGPDGKSRPTIQVLQELEDQEGGDK